MKRGDLGSLLASLAGSKADIAPPNPIPIWTTGIGWSDLIPVPGIGSIFDPIPNKYQSGDWICYILDTTKLYKH